MKSIYYNMKSICIRLQSLTDSLLECITLREDSLFLQRILQFGRVNPSALTHLQTLQQSRRVIQQCLIAQSEGILIDEVTKVVLFGFCNRIYKTIRGFHYKLLSFAPRVGQQCDTNAFLQELRLASIQMLTVHRHASLYLSHLLQRITTRYGEESANRQQESRDGLRNEKYLELLEGEQVQVVLMCYEHALKRIEKRKQPLGYASLLREVGQLVNAFTPLAEESCCEFVLSKWSRMVRDMRGRNQGSQTCIGQYAQIYKQYRERNKSSRKGNQGKSTEREKKRREKIGKSSEFSRKQEEMTIIVRKSQVNQTMQSIGGQEMLPPLNFMEINCQDSRLLERIYAKTSDKRNVYRIQKQTTQNKSYTLKPLIQTKQNTRAMQPVRQTIIQMKIEEKNIISKVMRLRRKRPLLALREDNIIIDQPLKMFLFAQ